MSNLIAETIIGDDLLEKHRSVNLSLSHWQYVLNESKT